MVKSIFNFFPQKSHKNNFQWTFEYVPYSAFSCLYMYYFTNPEIVQKDNFLRPSLSVFSSFFRKSKIKCVEHPKSLSKDVFERRTSTGSEVFSLTTCLDAKKFVLISFFSLLKTIYLRVSTKPLPNDAKRPLPVDVRRSKTLLLKLPVTSFSNFITVTDIPTG